MQTSPWMLVLLQSNSVVAVLLQSKQVLLQSKQGLGRSRDADVALDVGVVAVKLQPLTLNP